jgi:ribosome-associated protein
MQARLGALVSKSGLQVNDAIVIPDSELITTGIRAQGPGGQNVNKVSSAVQLRFDIRASTSLPGPVKERLLSQSDRRISSAGVVTIKAQRSRSQEKNRIDALKRLKTLLLGATIVAKKRVPTKPSKNSKQKRLDDKSRRSRLKQSRGKFTE